MSWIYLSIKTIRLLTVNINKHAFVSFLLVVSINYCFSQVNNQLFFNYLMNNKFYNEAEICLRNNRNSFSKDSFNINFIKCKTYNNQLDSTLYFLGKIDLNNYPKLMLLQNDINIRHKGEFKIISPKNYFINDDSLAEYFLIQRLGSKLLNDSLNVNFASFDIKYNLSVYQNLQEYNCQKIKLTNKKPIVAAIYSALIPGLGKLYCHKKKQALTSFAINAVFAAQSIESYIKLGPQSGRFIVFTGIGSVFYLSNIFGSFLVAKNYRKSKNQAINNAIKDEIRINTDYFFN